MAITSIGVLHPGEMGAGIGAGLVEVGHTVKWASSGRSPASRRRAEASHFVDAGSIQTIIASCDLILSVCPPSAALDVAKEVAGFGGLYLDANAIAPSTARQVAAVIESGGGRYVDGGIIGPPPGGGSVTRLYLSGPSAPEASEVFSRTAVDARVISEDPSAASALKMCFAAWSKGTTALLLDIRALAIAVGVEGPLLAEWRSSMPDLGAQSLKAAQQAASKGWRWVGEMDQIAATFRAVGLPDGFHRAAAEVYARPARRAGRGGRHHAQLGPRRARRPTGQVTFQGNEHRAGQRSGHACLSGEVTEPRCDHESFVLDDGAEFNRTRGVPDALDATTFLAWAVRARFRAGGAGGSSERERPWPATCRSTDTPFRHVGNSGRADWRRRTALGCCYKPKRRRHATPNSRQ